MTLTLKAFCNSFQHFKRFLSVIFIFCFRNYSLSPTGPSMNLHSNGTLRHAGSNNTECWVLLPSHYPSPRNSYWVAPKIWHWLHQFFLIAPSLKIPSLQKKRVRPCAQPTSLQIPCSCSENLHTFIFIGFCFILFLTSSWTTYSSYVHKFLLKSKH